MGTVYNIGRALVTSYYRIFYSVDIYGQDRWVPGKALVASSHASNYDPTLVALLLAPHELYYMAKESLFKIPVFKHLIRLYNAYPVSPHENDLKSIRRTYQLLKEDKQILVFPEGLRSFDGELNPIKRGVGVICAHSRCNIMPVYIHGNFETWNRNMSRPRFFTKMTLVLGTPILWEDFSHLPKKEAQQAICEAVAERLDHLKRWVENGAKGVPP